jgi:hypothetical protein
MNFKRAKLAAIMETIIKEVMVVPDKDDSKDVVDLFCKDSKECVSPCPDTAWDKCLVGIPKEKIEEFKTKISEQLLINNNFYFDSRTKYFRSIPSELLFEHHDIILGKHLEYIKRLQDPYRILHERLNEEFGEYIFGKTMDEKDYLSSFIESEQYKDNYDKFKTILRNCLVVDHDDKYHSIYIYQVFEAVHKVLNQAPNSTVDAKYLKSLAFNGVINDYETEELKDLLESKCFEHLWKQYKNKHKLETIMMVRPTLKICTDLVSSLQYFPSFYEIKVISEFVGINVVIFTRSSTKNNINGLELIDNKSSHYLLIHHRFDNKHNRDIFSLMVITEDMTLEQKKKVKSDPGIMNTLKKKVIFTKVDLKRVLDLIKLKDVEFEIEVSDNALDSHTDLYYKREQNIRPHL